MDAHRLALRVARSRFQSILTEMDRFYKEVPPEFRKALMGHQHRLSVTIQAGIRDIDAAMKATPPTDAIGAKGDAK